MLAAPVISPTSAWGARRGPWIVNAATLVLDLEQIDQPDASYDVVLCREASMFAVEPERAVAEIHRAPRPGGRVAVAGGGEGRQPLAGRRLRRGERAARPAHAATGHTRAVRAWGDAGRLEGLLAGAGFADVVVEEAAMPLRLPSFDAYWTCTSAIAGPLATILAPPSPRWAPTPSW